MTPVTRVVNHYAVLGVRRGAGFAEIRGAYVRRLKNAHPDLDQPHIYPQARLEDLQRAYRCLCDAEARAAHDAALDADEVARTERLRRRQKRLARRAGPPMPAPRGRPRPPVDRIRARWRLALLLALLAVVGLEVAKRS